MKSCSLTIADIMYILQSIKGFYLTLIFFYYYKVQTSMELFSNMNFFIIILLYTYLMIYEYKL